MGLLQRMFRVLFGWLGIGVSRLEDPEVILEAAQNELQEKLRAAKLQGAAALQQKNQLGMMLEDKRREMGDLEAKIKQAIQLGREDLAEALMEQMMQLEQAVQSLESQYQQAVQVGEQVKQQVAQFEREVQRKYQEKLLLKTQWKQAQVQEKLHEALSGISTSVSSESWDRAREKIQEKRARADALTELGAGNLQSQLRELDHDLARAAAKERIRKLKEELGQQASGQE